MTLLNYQKYKEFYNGCVLWYTGEDLEIIGATYISWDRLVDGGYSIDRFILNTNITTSTYWVCPDGVNSIQYLVQAGGGGGGSGNSTGVGGAGGAGGLKTGTLAVTPGQVYLITIGQGGASDTNGDGSVFATITTTGGGRGGNGTNINGNTGGCGGGGRGAGANPGTGGSGTSGEGSAGGNGSTSGAPSGGGGGTGGVGGNGVASTKPGDGGIGTQSSITGTATYYGGGGAGVHAGCPTNASPGLGGGGYYSQGTDGLGGGGAGGPVSTAGYRGGSGVVIIRYATQSGFDFIGKGVGGFPIKPAASTITPSGFWIKSPLGNNKHALRFNGTTNKIAISNDSSLYVFASNFTVSFWVNIPANINYVPIYGQSNGTIYAILYLDANVGDPRIILISDDTGGVRRFYYRHNLSPGWSLNTWYYVTLVRSGTTLYIYINMVSKTVTIDTAWNSPANLGLAWSIGEANSLYGKSYIRHLMVFNRALSSGEIKFHMDRTNPDGLHAPAYPILPGHRGTQ